MSLLESTIQGSLTESLPTDAQQLKKTAAVTKC